MKTKITFLINQKRKVLLDGYPRQIEQAQFLEQNFKINLVISLHADNNIIIERLSGRRICSNGHIYHLITMPPKNANVCYVDGLRLIHDKMIVKTQ